MAGVTLRRRRLAAELRRLRERSGLTIEQAATEAEISKSALSRIENAAVIVRIPALKSLLTVYRASQDELDALLQLARDANRPEWWQSYRDSVNEQFINYVALEASATSARQFDQLLVPGLLQSREYATALLGGIQLPPNTQLERLVDLRMARQSVLKTLEYWVIMEEVALSRAVCPPAEMADQLRHLVDMSTKPNLRIQVIPKEIPVHPGLQGSFTILEFEDPKDPEVIYIESMSGQLLLEEGSDARRIGSIFDQLRATALDFNSSRDRIEAIIQEMDKRR